MTESKRYNRREMINVVIHILKGNLQILKTPRRKTLPRKYILNPIAPEPYIILVSQEVFNNWFLAANAAKYHKDSVEHFDDFRRRKSGQNDDFRGRFYAVAEFASLGAENGYCLTIFGAENRAKMTILGTNRWFQ